MKKNDDKKNRANSLNEKEDQSDDEAIELKDSTDKCIWCPN
jgi:hypothetical protein